MKTQRDLPKIFFGWWIVIASFLIGVYTSGIIIYGFTAILEPVVKEFGWTYAQISLAASLRGLEEGFIVPLMGALVDRLGPRRIIFVSSIAIATGFIVLSYAKSLAGFYGAYVIIGIGTSGTGSTILVTAVANWFRARAGLGIAIATSGYMVGGLLSPIIVKL